MLEQSTKPSLPGWLCGLGSVVIVFHFATIVALVLSVPSGPWPTGNGGSDMAFPPAFAESFSELTSGYVKALNMDYAYHFHSNHPDIGVRFEAILRDGEGKEIQTIAVPDPQARFAVRYRQALLARALAGDMPLPLPEGELVQPRDREPPRLRYWSVDSKRVGTIKEVEEYRARLTLGNRDPSTPSPWSVVVARSYARHLCAKHDAASAEITRYSQSFFMPAVYRIPPEGTPNSLEGEGTMIFGDPSKLNIPVRRG